MNVFDKLTKDPNLILLFFFLGGGGGGEGGGLVNIREQMFQMTLLLFKENTCAKLF